MRSGISKPRCRRMPLYELLGGIRETIACGVSIGILPSLEKLMEKVAYRPFPRAINEIKLKCKPVLGCKDKLEAVRNRWPENSLSCDANSAYRLRDCRPLGEPPPPPLDQFNLLMIDASR